MKTEYGIAGLCLKTGKQYLTGRQITRLLDSKLILFGSIDIPRDDRKMLVQLDPTAFRRQHERFCGDWIYYCDLRVDRIFLL